MTTYLLGAYLLEHTCTWPSTGKRTYLLEGR